MKILISLALFFALPVLSCKKDKLPGDGTGKVEVYQLSSYQSIPTLCRIDPASAVLNNSAIITNDEIISYNKTTYEFVLKSTAFEKGKALNDFAGLAIKVDNELIYYFIHKPFISSSSCSNSLTASFWMNNVMKIELGYPGTHTTVVDTRNDLRLLAALNKQGKLK
jgi:hypothetical protein